MGTDSFVRETTTASFDGQAKTKWQKLKEGVEWYRPGTTAQEKKLLFKLDCAILVFGCLSSFSKTLDNSSLTNAYVSGMKEDLNLGGNDLNYLTAVYYSSYLTFMIPGSFLLTRLPIQRVLPTMEILWGVCTFGCAWAHSLRDLYVCRFFLGACETVAFTGLIYVIGSWYLREEMGVRVALFNISSPLGSMISGYLQTATYTRLEGHHGMAGWRWLFIVCFCITLPCALIGYVFFPNSPNNTKPTWWLSQAEIDLANKRLQEEGIRKIEKKIKWKELLRVLKDWPWYCFVFAWCLFDQNQYFSSTPFSLYLKNTDSVKYTIPQINNYPTVSKAVTIVTTVLGCYYADKTGDRFTPCLVATVLTTVAAGILLGWNVSEGGRLFAFFVAGIASSMNPFQMSWASDVVKEDPEARSLITASMNCIGQVFLAWVPIFTFPVPHAPRFMRGFTFSLITSVLHVLLVILIFFLERRDLRSGKRFKKVTDFRALVLERESVEALDEPTKEKAV
ncbi:major facilitator superfamily domain-containing protein [Lipomyces tetrasporus]|uniref:Major facilitator superfamily domain-containing protein n=1 Tax=Lipomyces tetrasporus TaxID=54092 RepID=A0AAD7QWX7_9ASCO|nr:major facilitator superfamily domain-containing protein [Lipomyces tetrasporus]KAJ8102411.1 major facilitator superfamily domain-containing protein [Lipomyces tetrasporus]